MILFLTECFVVVTYWAKFNLKKMYMHVCSSTGNNVKTNLKRKLFNLYSLLGYYFRLYWKGMNAEFLLCTRLHRLGVWLIMGNRGLLLSARGKEHLRKKCAVALGSNEKTSTLILQVKKICLKKERKTQTNKQTNKKWKKEWVIKQRKEMWRILEKERRKVRKGR